MSKLFTYLITGLAFSILGQANQSDFQARLARLEALVQQQQQTIKQQQQEISALRDHQEESVTLAADFEVSQDNLEGEMMAALKESELLTFGKNVDGLALKNDARFRYEVRDRDNEAANRERLRLRLRLGGTYTNKTENWKFGLGLEVGSDDHDSANQTLNNSGTFSSLDIFLDYAYATHSWDQLSLTVGQMKNPFKTTNLVWDGDIRPVGAAVGYDNDGMFATLAWFDAHSGDGTGSAQDYNDDALIVAGQVGFEAESEDASWGAALGYMAGNEAVDTHLSVAASDEYDAQVGDLYAWLNTDLGDVDLKVFGHAALNFGADGASLVAGEQADDNDLAWTIGAQAGIAKFKLKYAYRHIEADSVIGSLTDSDFGSGVGASGNTNVEGHTVYIGYKLLNSVELGLNSMFYDRIEGPSRDAKYYQLDLKYKF